MNFEVVNIRVCKLTPYFSWKK